MSVSINAICRKDRINQNRTTNIYLRFTVNRRSRYVSTGINIPADDWDFDTQTLKTQNPAVQLRIYEQIEKYDKRIKRLEALEVPVTLDNVLETDGRRVYCTIAEYFRRTITQLESVGKIGSASKHKVTFSLLQQFRSTNIRFDEITVGYLRDFELFLMKKGNKSNSIATKFSVLKAVYNKALAEGIFTTPHSPFLQFKIGRLWTATRKRAIRKEDVQRLMQAEIPADGSAYLDFARDIFLFSYLSAGINFKDIATLRYCDMDNKCSSLTSIEIPASVETIKASAFKGCSSLATVTFENGSQLKTIEGGYPSSGTFADCTALTSIEIPASVETIEAAAFKGCSSLATVTFEKGSQLKTIGGGGSSYYGAFGQLKNLMTVDMSACTQVKTIGESAFDGDSELRLFKIGTETPPTCGRDAFSGINPYSVLKVPSGCADAYKAKSGWNNFASITGLDE
ncbi:leucine-rich repeat protein [Alistipes putredinis]|uniref:leucine-rich repeat protein n=3 Tax=Alistipes TaxID=239759 RepID=UPI003AF69ED7